MDREDKNAKEFLDFWITLKGTLVSPSPAAPSPGWVRGVCLQFDDSVEETIKLKQGAKLERKKG